MIINSSNGVDEHTVTFLTLRKVIQHVGSYVKRLRADILDDWAESCEVEEL
jgi:hypothetical protein